MRGGFVYPIDPYQPVRLIAADLRSRAEEEAELELGRSLARAVRLKNSQALLALALGHCVWRGERLDGHTLSEMVEVMVACGARKIAANDE